MIMNLTDGVKVKVKITMLYNKKLQVKISL